MVRMFPKIVQQMLQVQGNSIDEKVLSTELYYKLMNFSVLFFSVYGLTVIPNVFTSIINYFAALRKL